MKLLDLLHSAGHPVQRWQRLTAASQAPRLSGSTAAQSWHFNPTRSVQLSEQILSFGQIGLSASPIPVELLTNMVGQGRSGRRRLLLRQRINPLNKLLAQELARQT